MLNVKNNGIMQWYMTKPGKLKQVKIVENILIKFKSPKGIRRQYQLFSVVNGNSRCSL